MRKRGLRQVLLSRLILTAFLLVAVLLGFDEGTFGVHRPGLGVLAFVRDGDVWIASGSGGNAEKVVEDASSPAWSPDGRKLAFARRGELWFLDLATNVTRQVTSTGRRASDPAWLDPATLVYSLRLEFDLKPTETTAVLLGGAPRGQRRRVAVTSLWVADTYSGRPEELLGPVSGGPIGELSSAAVHPQTGKLAFVLEGDVWIAETGREPLTARRAAACADLAITPEGAKLVAGARHLTWTPDGVWVVLDVVDTASQETGELWAVNSFTGKTIRITHRAEFDLPPAHYPSVSPAGGLIAYEEGNDVWLCGLDGSDSRRFIQNASQPAWSPHAVPLRRPEGLLLPTGGP